MRRFAKAAALPLLLVLSLTFGTRGGVLQVPTSTWVPAANLIAARADSTATLLQDGRVLIAGGADANGAALATAEFFGADGSVNAAAPMNFARTRHFAVALQDGRVLVGGGMGANGMPMFSAEIFDPIANAWTPTGSGMVEARAGAAAGLLPDGRVAISGGDSGSLPSMTIEIFDPASGGFSAAGTMSAPRTKHAMAVLRDGRVMIFGGWNRSAILQTTDIFDPATGQMAPGPQMLAARMSHTATSSLTGPVVIAGGNDGKNHLNTVEIFDPATGAFAAGPNLAAARQGQLAVLLPNNNNILFVGGTAAGAVVANAEMYSPWQGAMTAAGANAIARSKAAAAGTGADGVLLVSGGADANGAALNGNELYGFATVKTDAADYAPGTTVTITGKGWAPGETVTLTLVESPLVDTHPVMTEVADANGNFVNTDFSPDTHDLNIRFFLTAVGSNSGSQAMNTFTDGNATSVSGTVTSSAAGNPAISAATVSCSVSGTNPCNSPAVSATTNAGGTYFFDQAHSNKISFPGTSATVRLTASATGFNSNSRDVALTNGGTTAGQNIVLTPISAANSTVVANPTSVPADGASTSTITVTVLDASSQPVNGKTVTLGQGGGSSTISPASATTNTSGVATFTVKDVTALTVTYTATVDGITITQTAAVTFTAINVGTTTAVTSSLNPSNYGQSVTFTAKVAPASGSTAPTGSVQFKIDGVNSGSPVAVSACAPSPDACATLNTSALAAGNHTVEADFTGTGLFTNSSGTLSGGQDVNKATLTASIIGDPTKPYNGDAAATLTSGNFSLSGLAGSDSFTVTKTSGTYNSKDVAAANTVTASLAAGDFTPNGGTLASNYTLPTTASGPGHITALTPTAAIIGDPTRPYNGNTNATLTSANFSLSGLNGTDSFTVTKTSGTYNSKDVATANTVTASLAAGDFTANGTTVATNYSLPTSASGPGHITAVTLTAAIIGDPTRPYNGNANATLTAANFSLSGLVGTESFTITQTAGTYNSANVTAANSVSASLAAGDFTPGNGADAGNYVLPTTASGPGHITAVTLTAAIIGDPTRPYNGNANATLTSANFSLSGLVGTESFTITQTAGTYNSANVATANTVTANLAAGDFTPGAGTLASNYTLPTTASGPGHITAVTLTAAIIGDPTKFFDGNANATLTPANFSITGLISPESISVTQSVGSYDSANTSATTVTAALAPGNFSAGAGTLLSNYNLPTTASGPGTIKPDVTTTGVSSSVNPSIFGQSVTFTATVTNTSTAATPTGSVQFVIDGVNYGSPVALSGATNTATGTVMTAAINVNGSPHSVSANFVNADGNFINSNGALSGGQTVNPAPTSTSVSSSANPSVFGQSITFTATVTNTAGAGVSTATPTGSVQFIVDGVNFGSPIAVSGSGGIASATSGSISNLNVNGSPHSVKAVFTNSDGNFSGSMNTLTGGQTVTKAATSTAVQSSLNPSIFGQSVTFTATVTNTSTGATPTGSVQFVVDGVNFGAAIALAGSGNSATATSSATATLTVPGSPHSIVANYSNSDGNFSNSSGNTTQTVTKAATSTTVTTSGSPSTLHQNVTFTATVVDSTPMSTGTPTGTVNFYDGVNPIGSGTLNGAGVATFSTTTLAVGTHSITAQYVGDLNFTGSTSSAISQVVQYNFCLLYDPTRSVKSGATYPVKIYACDASGADVSSSSIVVHATLVTQISGFSGAPDDAGSANPDNDFRFDVTLGPSGGYIFNLKTSGLASGTYMLNFTATNDPTTHLATFGVK